MTDLIPVYRLQLESAVANLAIQVRNRNTRLSKLTRETQTNLGENKKGAEVRFIIIHGLQRRTFREQEEYVRSQSPLSKVLREQTEFVCDEEEDILKR